jgi:exodeoxyribonuclease III
MPMKIISWNVNGIRACAKKGFLQWLATEKPDILCVQETKAWPEQLDEELKNPKGYTSYFACAEKKGYSGVAFYIKSRLRPLKVDVGIGKKKFDSEGRTLIAHFEKFIIIGGYYPNGQHDHGRVPYKLEYSNAILKIAKNLEDETAKPVILTGDFNTAHHPIDLKNPKSNKESTGFLPIERKFMDKLQAKGYIDIFRERHPGQEGHYTWWSYRSTCRERNIGWRIDYFFVPESMNKKTTKAGILPSVLGSDHCPISLSFSN